MFAHVDISEDQRPRRDLSQFFTLKQTNLVSWFANQFIAKSKMS